MSIKDIKHAYALAAAHGRMPDELVIRATLATVLEAGSVAFHRSYYGDKIYSEATSNVRAMDHAAKETAVLMAESVTNDLQSIKRVQRETLTTSDFPVILGQIRAYTVRGSYNPLESDFAQYATKRTAPNFMKLRGIRVDSFNRLVKRPEGTSVTYAQFGETTDGYQVANYELGVPFTWEAWVNDDIGEFTAAMANLGIAARRTRNLVIIEAIKNMSRVTLPSGAGGPDNQHLIDAYQALAQQTNSAGLPMPRMLTDFAFPLQWTMTANQAIRSELLIVSGGGTTQKTVVSANPAYGIATPHPEGMLAEVVPAGGNAADWVVFDNRQQWLEFATLQGYEGGPKTFTKLPSVAETDLEGSFENHTIAVKMSDNVGALVTDPKSALLIAGA